MAGLFALPVPRVGCDVVGFVDALFLLLDLFIAGALAWWGPGLIGQLVSFWDEVGNHVLGGTLCALFLIASSHTHIYIYFHIHVIYIYIYNIYNIYIP